MKNGCGCGLSGVRRSRRGLASALIERKNGSFVAAHRFKKCVIFARPQDGGSSVKFSLTKKGLQDARNFAVDNNGSVSVQCSYETREAGRAKPRATGAENMPLFICRNERCVPWDQR